MNFFFRITSEQHVASSIGQNRMLPTSFTDRFSQIMDLKDQELASEAQGRFAKRSAEYAKRGIVVHHITPSIHHENATWMIPARIEFEVEAVKLLLSSGHELAYSETLATELKQLIESWTTEIWCKQLVDRYGPLTTDQRRQYDNDLFQIRKNGLIKANLQIDLIVDSLKSKIGNTQPQTKEREQKFGILLSARQADIDFQDWAKELKPLNGVIAILFVDIDNFKPFNTQYTNAVVDETILPDAMRLIQNVMLFRGGAYRHGGEEFLLILPNYDLSEATTFAKKVRTAFEETGFKVKDKVERLTVSIGIALWPKHGSRFSEVLEAANSAEIEAKGPKNSCVCAKC